MFRTIILISLTLAANLPGQGASPRIVKCRLVAFEKAAGSPTELYSRSLVKGELIKNQVSLSIDAVPVEYPVAENGKLVFLAAEDTESPVVATATLPKNASRFILLLIPSSTGGKSGYRIIPIEESAKNTPVGGAYICNISSTNARVTMGEFKYELLPGKSVSIAQPKKRDEYNMAPLSIQLSGNGKWVSVKDSTTRFSKRDRYFMFTYVKPKLNRPMVKIYQQSVAINTMPADRP